MRPSHSLSMIGSNCGRQDLTARPTARPPMTDEDNAKPECPSGSPYTLLAVRACSASGEMSIETFDIETTCWEKLRE